MSADQPDLLSETEESSNGKRSKNKEPKIKRPSKIFTEYYGSLILLLIALLVAFGFLVIKPKIDDYKDMRAYTETLRMEAENETIYLNALRRSVAAAQTISPDVLSRVDRALPHDFSIPETLVQMGEAADASNVMIQSIAFDQGGPTTAKATAKGLRTVNMTLTVQASNYFAFKRFLQSLELSLRILDIQMISVSSFEADKASFSLQMKTYYYSSAADK